MDHNPGVFLINVKAHSSPSFPPDRPHAPLSAGWSARRLAVESSCVPHRTRYRFGSRCRDSAISPGRFICTAHPGSAGIRSMHILANTTHL
eukprot:6686965-Alexandrium_andersonii.AAC.1